MDFLNLDWDSIENLCIRHARKVLTEAKKLRKQKISAYSFSKEIKLRWEREIYHDLSKMLDINISLWGKDSGHIGDKKSNLTLVVDLFDGSINFLMGAKYFSYNVALLEKSNLIFGLSIDLENFDCYTAYFNKGSYLNGRKLKGPLPYADRIICSNVMIESTAFLHFGCASLELCMLAKGACDIVVGQAGFPDIAAALLIALETNSVVVKDWEFKDLEIPPNRETIQYIAGNKRVLENFQKKFENLKNIIKPMPSTWPNIVKRGKIGINYE